MSPIFIEFPSHIDLAPFDIVIDVEGYRGKSGYHLNGLMVIISKNDPT